jgi:hypothetical protein
MPAHFTPERSTSPHRLSPRHADVVAASGDHLCLITQGEDRLGDIKLLAHRYGQPVYGRGETQSVASTLPTRGRNLLITDDAVVVARRWL